MPLLSHLIEIFVLGLISGAIPGPIITAVFTETLNGGLGRGFIIILRALFAESFFAFFILFVLSAYNIPPFYFSLISLAGAAVLFWLAIQVYKIRKIENKDGEIFSLSKIFLITALSGAFWIFWITICTPRALSLQQIIPAGQYVFGLIFEFGWLISTTLLAFIFSRFRPILTKRNLVSSVFKLFALILILFALESLHTGLEYFWN